MAFGDNAVWISKDGRTWTLAGTRGITPRQSSDRINVVTNTPDGFLAAGYQTTSAGSQAVIWTSRDGVTWQRLTAAQLGLQEPAERSDDGGRTWQPVPFTAPGSGVSFNALTARSGGFATAAQFGSVGGTMAAAVWTSADGTSWTRSPVSGLTGGGSHAITALAASGAAVTAIDTVQTQASQQFVVLRLPSG